MKIDQPGSHLDHMLRQTRMHHVQLSTMADLKANIVLTMSSVLVTLAAPQLFNPEFRWPFLVLISFCLVTVALAVYAVMPKLHLWRKQPQPADVNDPKFDLLFFGNFVRLDYDTFSGAMEKVLNDHNLCYEVQVRELYSLGIYLARKKYRFLRLAYLFFGMGICLSTLVFVGMLIWE